MREASFALALLLAAGCTDDQQFRHDADLATCEWKESCFEEDFNACIDAAEEQFETTGCAFDERHARRCLRGLENLECPSAEQTEVPFPQDCAQVWDCP